MAFAGRATTFAELHRAGVEHKAMKPRAEHYAPASRAALHHLERGLFEPDEAQLFDPDPVDPGDAITLLEGGGERAELELVAAEAARLIRRAGVAPEEIAVVLRKPADHAALLSEVFGAFGVPVALDRRVAFGHTPLGRGLVGLARCALADGTSEDLLAYLRTPGLLQRPELADRLETRARQEGARTADAARALWEAKHWRLEAIDRVSGAARRGGAELLERLATELQVAVRRAPPPRGAGAHRRAGAGRRGAARRALRARATRHARPRRPRAGARPRRARRAPARPRGPARHAAGTGRGDRRRAAGAARAPRADPLRLRPAGGRLPRAAAHRAVLRRRRARADRRGLRPAAAPARRPRRRALPLLRRGLAARGAPLSLLARGRRRRRAARALVLRLRRLRPVRRASCTRVAGRARSARSAGRRGRRRASASACAARPIVARAAARRRWRRSPTSGSSRACATVPRGRRRASSCGRAAR